MFGLTCSAFYAYGACKGLHRDKAGTVCRLDHGSKMSRQYAHFLARNLEDAVLKLHGLMVSEPSKALPRLVDCPRCGTINTPGSLRCSFCGLILDRKQPSKWKAREKERL